MRATPSPSSRPLVLVVEDEPLVRLCAVDMIRDAGFEAWEAASVPAALRVLEARAAEVCAVFTDVDMPGGMDGAELARTASRCWPWIGLVVTSGHRAAAGLDLPPRAVFLPKPYREREVLAELRRLMG